MAAAQRTAKLLCKARCFAPLRALIVSIFAVPHHHYCCHHRQFPQPKIVVANGDAGTSLLLAQLVRSFHRVESVGEQERAVAGTEVTEKLRLLLHEPMDLHNGF
jgi:hypothetical protein